MNKHYFQLMIVALCTCAGPVAAQQASTKTSIVIPAKAGIQKSSRLYSRLRGNDESVDSRLRENDEGVDSRLRGNDSRVSGNAKTNDETVGTLQGKLKVTPTGAATYSIPITVSPGTAGIAPKLSITYNSQGQNGSLGMGFSLQGLTAITRAPSNKAQNGNIHGVDFTKEDRFNLNGQQLVAVKGAYGQDQTEYRTYIDSQSKIVSIGQQGTGPASFKVWTKGGQIAEYGVTADSALRANEKRPDGSVIDGDTIKSWALDKIQDSAGNYLKVHYTKDSTTGELYPNEIDYTGNDAQKLMPYNQVKFVYEDRPDTSVRYMRGSKFELTKRLKEIDAEQNGKLVYAYKFGYVQSPDTGRSLLISLQKCAGDGICLKPTRFHWQEAKSKGWTSQPQLAAPTPISVQGTDQGVRFADLNGDGHPDILKGDISDVLFVGHFVKDAWLYTPKGWKHDGSYSPPTAFAEDKGDLATKAGVVDLNGDGQIDILGPTISGGVPTGQKTWSYKNGQWGINKDYSPPTNIHTTEGRLFVDLNGDGLPDMLINGKAWINNGHGWDENDSYKDPVPGGQQGARRFYLDLIGNGLTDMVQSQTGDKGDSGAWINTGSGWQKEMSYEPPLYLRKDGKNAAVRFIDVNGDGLPDLLYGSCDGTRTTWLNTGRGWVKDDNYRTPLAFEDDDHRDIGVRFIDLNGDGLLDIVRSGNGVRKEILNTGHGWKVVNPTYSVPVDFVNNSGLDEGVRIIDLNGDGIPDLIENHSDDAKNYKGAWLAQQVKPDLLIGMTNNFGTNTNIDYEPLSGTEADVYTQEKNSDGTLDSKYPNPQFDGPMYVVYQTASDTDVNDPQTKAKYASGNGQVRSFSQGPHSTISSDVDGLQHITTYHYTGARINKLGFGFLGFHKVQITDNTTGITSTTTYNQDPSQHNVNQPLSKVTSKANGPVLSQTDNTWNLKKIYGDGTVNQTVYFPYIQKTVKKKYSLKGNLLSTVTTNMSLDDYANPVHFSTITEDSTGTYLTDTKNTYHNDPDKWFLGELTQAQVTRNAPSIPSITRTSTFQYDPNTGMLLQIAVEPDDPAFTKVTTYKRDAFGNIISTTISGKNFSSRTKSVTYDSQGRFVVQSKNELGQITKQTVDPRFGKPLTVTNPNGLVITDVYDAWGRLINKTNPDGTQQSIIYQWNTATTPQRRDAIHRVSSGAENSTIVGIGMNNEPIHATYSVTAQTTDTHHQPIGPAQTKYYDALNRNVAKTTQGLDGTLIWSDTFYDDLGRVVQQCQKHFDGDKIYFSRLKYDVLGRMIETDNADGTKIQVQYDGYKTTTINQLNQSTTKITNAMGKVIESIDTAGKSTHYHYDAYGNLLTMTDSAGHVSMLSYDKLGHKIGMNDPDKGTWTYTYDALGNLLSQTNANGKRVSMQYDLLNRLISRTDEGNTSTWAYGNNSSQHNVGQLIQVTGVADNHPQRRDAIHRVSTPSIAQKLQAERNGIADYTRTITYDTDARPSTTTVSINGANYTTKVHYDSDTGRPDQTTYSNGITIRHVYNPLGYLTDEQDAKTGQTYWHLNQMDAEGHVTSFKRSNGLVTTKMYNPANGFLTDIETHAGTALQLQQAVFPTTTHYLNNGSSLTSFRHSRIGVNPEGFGTTLKGRLEPHRSGDDVGKGIQDLHYTYDALGNVQEKDNTITETKNTYTYDNLNRLTAWNQNGTAKRTYGYDAQGNMTYKSDVGHYHYGDQAGPHAVTSITDDSGKTIGTMQYDADGNQTSETLNGQTRKVSYTSYGKPLQITSEKAAVNFYYNADRNRFLRVDTQGTKVDTTMYLGNEQIVTHKDGTTITTETKVTVGGSLLVLNLGKQSTYDLLTDNLGSMTVLTDGNGGVVNRLRYTPFGEQSEIARGAINRVSTRGEGNRKPSSEAASKTSNEPITHQGFTGHEALESVNLIHMNGRLYDPVLGRFLSADPKIQDPMNSQSLNRYSYCLNNPLAFTDPTGYSWISDLWHDVTDSMKDILTNQYVDIGISIAIGCIPGMQWYGIAACEALFTMGTTAAEGGNLDQILTAGALSLASSIAFHATGSVLQGLKWDQGGVSHLVERSLAHGLIGGGLQVAEGGHFQDGFLIAAIGEAAPVNDIGGKDAHLTPSLIAERTTAAAIVGGTTAAATGGNFINGAKTAAYAELFNDCQHSLMENLSDSADNFTSGIWNGFSCRENFSEAEKYGIIDKDTWSYQIGHMAGRFAAGYLLKRTPLAFAVYAAKGAHVLTYTKHFVHWYNTGGNQAGPTHEKN